jgi:hypothetical protein
MTCDACETCFFRVRLFRWGPLQRWLGLNAKVQLLPAMNAEDLKWGLDVAKQAM